MAFLYGSFHPVLPKPVIFFCLFLAYIRHAISLLLHRLGLYTLPEPLIAPWGEAAEDAAPSSRNHQSIKKRLRVVEFGSLSRTGQMHQDPTCVICLGELEATHKVRELGNCGHGFHLECMDRWVDVGRTTCPLCRARLLPSVEKHGMWARLLRLP
ncbi:zinc finger, C3HC4 type, domain containing protein [Musa troglodytarum]|uniref:Zinc finger, C3HC4 type, domain containing protein n=1 Tax=Musa troglodytarum TaxID=320322 RepID=A0A9E7JYA8_9LILI|nr:zinc finger, C3HC4 type, domain containing protein [Musa troglodytarum]